MGGLDPIFVKALDGLPRKIKTDRDKFRYEMFTRAWGTHYISGANFGGKLIHNVYVDTDWYSSQQSSWVSSQISLNFHYDAFDNLLELVPLRKKAVFKVDLSWILTRVRSDFRLNV